jgi:hypothetical protein
MEKKKYNAPSIKVAVMEKLMTEGVSGQPSDSGGDDLPPAKENNFSGTDSEKNSTWND